jgi:hypothetical protein
MNTGLLSVKDKSLSILSEREKHPELSVAHCCQRYGISAWSFYYWQKRLKQPILPQTKFLPVSISSAFSAKEHSPHHYVIRFPNSMTLEISGDFKPAHITELTGIIRKIRKP